MYMFFKFHVMRLDRYVGAFMFVVLTAEILTLIFIIYFIVQEVKKFRKFGKEYFKVCCLEDFFLQLIMNTAFFISYKIRIT